MSRAYNEGNRRNAGRRWQWRSLCFRARFQGHMLCVGVVETIRKA
jgi:hypothetical protein